MYFNLFYPVKHFLSKFKKDIDVNCYFCSLPLETVPHIFWHSSFVKKLWYDVSVFISEKTVFYKELESSFCTIQSSTNRKAIKTVSLCSVFKIFE